MESLSVSIPVSGIGMDTGVEYPTHPHQICAEATTLIPVIHVGI